MFFKERFRCKTRFFLENEVQNQNSGILKELTSWNTAVWCCFQTLECSYLPEVHALRSINHCHPYWASLRNGNNFFPSFIWQHWPGTFRRPEDPQLNTLLEPEVLSKRNAKHKGIQYYGNPHTSWELLFVLIITKITTSSVLFCTRYLHYSIFYRMGFVT